MTVSLVISVALSDISSDISSDILYEKPAAYAKIGLLWIMIACNGGVMVKLGEMELKMLIKGGETNTVELKMEQIGSGVRFMLDETKRMELPAPQFRETSEFIVTLQKALALRAPEP